MKKLKRLGRLMALVFMIALAAIIPFPMAFARKDDLPKFTIEQVDNQEEDDEVEDLKEIF